MSKRSTVAPNDTEAQSQQENLMQRTPSSSSSSSSPSVALHESNTNASSSPSVSRTTVCLRQSPTSAHTGSNGFSSLVDVASVHLPHLDTTNCSFPTAVVAVPIYPPFTTSENGSLQDGKVATGLYQRIQHIKSGVSEWCDKFSVVVAITAWYIVGVLAIVTTKIQLQDWKCPPLVLTVQQMFLGTFILRFVIMIRDGKLQPWPWDGGSSASSSSALPQPLLSRSTSMDRNNTAAFHSQLSNLSSDRVKRYAPWLRHPNFILSGVFNALDFVASNYAFSFSSAHFVETIKASEPITTTTIALLWNVDRLSAPEGASLAMLVAGVLLSTWGNSTDQQTSVTNERKLFESIQTAILTLSANVFFAFRAINQKRYRTITHDAQQMDDANFLCRMQQVGATFLIGPILFIHWDTIGRVLRSSWESRSGYLGLALVNAVSYVTYNLASCVVLSKLTVLHHSSLNCLRRMVAILATSIFFQKALSFEASVGLMTSFLGFASFTYHRSKRLRIPVASKDSNV